MNTITITMAVDSVNFATLTVVDSSTRSASVTNLQGFNYFRGLNFFTTGGGSFVVATLWDDNVSNTIVNNTQVTLQDNTCYEVTWILGNNSTTRPLIVLDSRSPIVTWNAMTFTMEPAFFYNVTSAAFAQYSKNLSSEGSFLTADAGQTPTPDPVYVNVTVQTDVPPMSFSTTPCCIVEDTVFRTNRGILKASQIKPGDFLFKQDGSAVRIHKNVRFTNPVNQFVELGLPGSEFLIMENHPILEDGQEILAKDSQNAKFVSGILPKIVHTFITEKRDFIDISGVSVGTWSQEAFDNFIQHDNRGRSQAFTLIE